MGGVVKETTEACVVVESQAIVDTSPGCHPAGGVYSETFNVRPHMLEVANTSATSASGSSTAPDGYD